MWKNAKTCEDCGERVPARYRALVDLFLCSLCYSRRVDEAITRAATGEQPVFRRDAFALAMAGLMTDSSGSDH